MYCNTCGVYNSSSCKFCGNCGTVALCENLYDDIPLPECPPEYAHVPIMPADFGRNNEINESDEYGECGGLKEEPVFFGKKALLFCLFIIAILSVTTGMFIGLYLYERDSAPSRGSSGSTRGPSYFKSDYEINRFDISKYY